MLCKENSFLHLAGQVECQVPPIISYSFSNYFFFFFYRIQQLFWAGNLVLTSCLGQRISRRKRGAHFHALDSSDVFSFFKWWHENIFHGNGFFFGRTGTNNLHKVFNFTTHPSKSFLPKRYPTITVFLKLWNCLKPMPFQKFPVKLKIIRLVTIEGHVVSGSTSWPQSMANYNSDTIFESNNDFL